MTTCCSLYHHSMELRPLKKDDKQPLLGKENKVGPAPGGEPEIRIEVCTTRLVTTKVTQ